MIDLGERLRAEPEHEILRDDSGAIRGLEKSLAHQAADEIDRLRQRLEVDSRHPYDGIACRDETIRQQDKEIERLTRENAQLAEFVVAVGGFWGHSKSVLVGPDSLAEAINRRDEKESK